MSHILVTACSSTPTSESWQVLGSHEAQDRQSRALWKTDAPNFFIERLRPNHPPVSKELIATARAQKESGDVRQASAFG